MNKQEELNKLQSRQLELMAQMKASDAYSCKCQKLGLVFSEAYPNDYAAYILANNEYNENEPKIVTLEEDINKENDTVIN